MTVLIAGGDSFTFGSELPSQEHAWSGLLAKKLGMNYCCTAMQVSRIRLVCCSYVEFS